MTLRDKPLEELDKLLFETEILIETGSDEERFLGAFQTIAGISKYLASKYPTLNRRPLTLILEELSDINNGAKPKLFASPKSKKGGRPTSTRKASAEALTVAGIELLIASGMEVSRAMEEASKIIKNRKPAQLIKIRKTFKSSLKKKEMTELMYRLKKAGLERATPYEAGLIYLKEAATHLK